jgi:PAS domain S-box-containing protein
MSQVLCLRSSPQKMSKYNPTVSNQKQVDALSAQDYWNISHAVTRLFTEAPDESPPADAMLRLLTTRLGWDVGGFWIVNELRMALECAAFYSPTPDSFKNFETVSRARRFSFGEGLPGSTWKSRGVVCFPDLSKQENFPRLSVAALEHLHTGVAFPLYVGKKVLGVVEFFSLEPRLLAPATQDFLFALGGQMGVFLERLSAGKNLEAANAQFLLVAEAASVAVFTIDEQSTILFANPFVEQLFGYSLEELMGKKLTLVMPEYLRHVHERGLAHYVATGQRHVSWDGIPLPGLHKNGEQIPLMISFGEFLRGGKRVFTGFAKLRATESG